MELPRNIDKFRGDKSSPCKARSHHQLQMKINFFMIAAYSLACCLLLSCENNEKMIEDWSRKKILIDQAKDVESYLSQQGKLKAKLTAPLMLQYETDSQLVEFPNSLHVDFYNDSTRIQSWVDAKHGKYFENLNKVYLWGNVVVINVEGDTLKSDDLWWDQNKRLFYTDNYAEYRTKDKQIYPGKGLEATEDFKKITFKEPTGTVNVSDKNFTK